MFPCQDFSLSAMRIGCIYTWNKDLIETCKYMLCFQQAAAYIQQLLAKMIRDKGEIQLQKIRVCPGLVWYMVPKWLKTGWFYCAKWLRTGWIYILYEDLHGGCIPKSLPMDTQVKEINYNCLWWSLFRLDRFRKKTRLVWLSASAAVCVLMSNSEAQTLASVLPALNHVHPSLAVIPKWLWHE